jgi:hypothetical protein
MNLDRMIDKDRARRIRDAIRATLMNDWDPIGVKAEPAAADEYDMYSGALYEMLLREESETSIAAHLREIEMKRMGFAEAQTPSRIDVAKALKKIPLN